MPLPWQEGQWGRGQGEGSGKSLVLESLSECPGSEQLVSVSRISRSPWMCNLGSPRASSSCFPVLTTRDRGITQAIPWEEGVDMSTVLTQDARKNQGHPGLWEARESFH